MAEQTETAPPAPVLKEHRFPCKKCGADLFYAPGQSAMQCPHCGHVEKIPQTADEIDEYSFNDYLAKPRSHGYGVPGARQQLTCERCGAVTETDPKVRATSCPFCGAPLVSSD